MCIQTFFYCFHPCLWFLKVAVSARPLLMPWLDWFHCAWCLLTFAGHSPWHLSLSQHCLSIASDATSCWSWSFTSKLGSNPKKIQGRGHSWTISVCASDSWSASLTPVTSVTTPCSACIRCIWTKALFGCSSIATNPHVLPSHRYYTASFRELQRMESVSRRWDGAGRCRIKEGCQRLLFQNIW